MRRKHPAAIALTLLLAIVISLGASSCAADGNTGDILTSGFIEATRVSIAPEMAGRIIAINASEGDVVKAGEIVVRLDDSLLKAQAAQSEAAVVQAQAAVEQSLAVVDQAQAAVEQTTTSRRQAIATREGARKALENAIDVQKNPLDLDAQLVAAQGQVDAARSALALATNAYQKIAYPYTYTTFALDIPTAVGHMAEAQAQLESARQKLSANMTTQQQAEVSQQLQRAIEKLTNSTSVLARGQGPDPFASGVLRAGDFWTVRAAQLQMEQAQSALATAEKTLQIMREKEANPQQIKAAVDSARAALDSASAAVEVVDSAVASAQKQVAIAQRQVGVAQKQVEQARAALEVIKVQIGKMTILSPISGTVTARSAEPGEMASPGVPVLTITDLDKVTLTAYVPESRIGRVSLGQKALVSVDSYPGQSFEGQVTFISPQALFTPGNIQLKDERERTVFPVKITLPNPDRKLKAGMPADARIAVGQ